MKVLVLNGSPKKEKSDMICITREFLGGISKALEQDIHKIYGTFK